MSGETNMKLTVTFIKNESRRMETISVIPDASTLFLHKVIFPVDNNIKSLETFAVMRKCP